MVWGIDYNKDLDSSLWFRLSNGKEVKSIVGLRDALKEIDGNIFYKHANPFKNDFSSWIKDVFHMNELADKIKKANKEQMIDILSRELKKLDSDEDEEKIQKMNQNLSEIENKVVGMGENESIDDALRRLQTLYKQKNEEHNPQHIIMHDAISDSESVVSLDPFPDINTMDDIKDHKNENKENIIQNTVHVEEVLKKDIVKQDKYREEPKPKVEYTDHKINSDITSEKSREIIQLRKENHDLLCKIIHLKGKTEELENAQKEFGNNLNRTHEHIHGLTKDIDVKSRLIESLKNEKNEHHDNLEWKKEKQKFETLIEKLKRQCEELEKETKDSNAELKRVNIEREKLEREIIMSRTELKECKKAGMGFDPKTLLSSNDAKEFETREKKIISKEAEIEQQRKILNERSNEISKNEKEIEKLRYEYMKNIRIIIDEGKIIKQREKDVEKKMSILKEKEKYLKEKESEIKELEGSITKRALKYDKEISSLKKELKDILR